MYKSGALKCKEWESKTKMNCFFTFYSILSTKLGLWWWNNEAAWESVFKMIWPNVLNPNHFECLDAEEKTGTCTFLLRRDLQTISKEVVDEFQHCILIYPWILKPMLSFHSSSPTTWIEHILIWLFCIEFTFPSVVTVQCFCFKFEAFVWGRIIHVLSGTWKLTKTMLAGLPSWRKGELCFKKWPWCKACLDYYTAPGLSAFSITADGQRQADRQLSGTWCWALHGVLGVKTRLLTLFSVLVFQEKLVWRVLRHMLVWVNEWQFV